MNKKIKTKAIIIILLSVAIAIALTLIILNVKNPNIEKPIATKEQLTQTTSNNSYVSMSGHLSELNNIETIVGKTTVTADKILKDYTAYKDGKIITGTMANNGAVSSTLNAGASYTIPAGYHNGSGKVTANTLASQTSATATAADIASGKTAYVNGDKITGTANTVGNLKKQTVSTSISLEGWAQKTKSFTFSNLTNVVGITNIVTQTHYTIYSNISISGNVVKVPLNNKSDDPQTFTVKVTAIGY